MVRSCFLIFFALFLSSTFPNQSYAATDFMSYARGPLTVTDECTKTPTSSSSSPTLVRTLDYVIGIRLSGDMVIDCSYTPEGLSTWITWCFEKRNTEALCTDYEATSAEGEQIRLAMAEAKKHPRTIDNELQSVTQPAQVTVVNVPAPQTTIINNTTNNYGYTPYIAPEYLSRPLSNVEKAILGFAVGLGIARVGSSIFGQSFISGGDRQPLWELGGTGSTGAHGGSGSSLPWLKGSGSDSEASRAAEELQRQVNGNVPVGRNAAFTDRVQLEPEQQYLSDSDRIGFNTFPFSSDDDGSNDPLMSDQDRATLSQYINPPVREQANNAEVDPSQIGPYRNPDGTFNENLRESNNIEDRTGQGGGLDGYGPRYQNAELEQNYWQNYSVPQPMQPESYGGWEDMGLGSWF